MSIANAAHCSMLGGEKALPYIPINGVRSDGKAYCALPGRIDASSGAFEADFTITSTYSGDWHAFGAHGSSNNRAFFLLNLQRTGTAEATYVFGSFTSPSSGLRFMPGNRYLLSSGRNQSGYWATLNGSSVFDRILGDPVFNSGQFLIFRASATNSQTNPQASSSPTFFVLHGLKVWYADTLVADLIPCREIATAEVCFYNQIDGTFIKNVTSGSLIEVS